MTGRRAADLLYGASLLTLPLIGFDPVRLISGVDVGAGFQVSYLLMAGAAVLAFAANGPRRLGAGWRAARPWSTLGLVTLGAVLLSAAGIALHPPAGLPEATPRLLRFGKQVIQLLIMFVFVGFPLFWTRGSARWEQTRRLFAFALLGQLLYGLLQGVMFGRASGAFAALERIFTSNPTILAGSEELFLGHGFTGIPRLRGTCCEPLYLGNYLLLAVPVLLLPGARRRHVVLALAGGGLLLMTWSRGAWLASGGLLGAWLLLSHRAGWRPRAAIGAGARRWLILVGLAGAVLAVVWWRPDALLLPARRLAQSVNREDWSNLTRFYSMQAAWRAFLLSPLVGVGWGQYGFHFVALADPLGLQSQFNWPVVNSYPLAILCETGIIGFAVFAAGSARLGRMVWRATKPGVSGPAGTLARQRTVLLGAAVIGIWSQLLTFSQYNLPHIWVALGLLLAALRETEAVRG